MYVLFPLISPAGVPAETSKRFNVAKTLLGQSSVFVNVPLATVKLLPLPDWSVTLLPSFKIKKPLVP